MFKEDHLVDDMDKIVKQTAHMSKTIEDFRDFFKSDKEKILFNVNDTIIQNNMIEINITDNGAGVPKDIINKVFDPYFTTKHQSQGTGIGLYMTHEIIVKHFNGQLYVKNVDFIYENKTYTGARFTIALPIITK
jgi:nitrogen fixation/metabolism regulation signal transduction histidine kinase